MALAPEVVLARIEARIATLRREAAELMYELTAAQTEAAIQASLEHAVRIIKQQARDKSQQTKPPLFPPPSSKP